MAAGSNGYRAALVSRQPTPGLISSLPETAGLLQFISFSTSYRELDSALRPLMRRIGDLIPFVLLSISADPILAAVYDNRLPSDLVVSVIKTVTYRASCGHV